MRLCKSIPQYVDNYILPYEADSENPMIISIERKETCDAVYLSFTEEMYQLCECDSIGVIYSLCAKGNVIERTEIENTGKVCITHGGRIEVYKDKDNYLHVIVYIEKLD